MRGPEQRISSGNRAPWRTLLLGGWAVLTGFLWLLTFLDYKAASVVGVHILHPYVLRVLAREGTFRDLALGRATYVSVAVAVGAVTLVHLAVAVTLRRACRRRSVVAGFVVVALVAPLAALLAGAGSLLAEGMFLVGPTPWQVKHGKGSLRLTYPPQQLVDPALGHRASVILIVADSLRGDAWGAELMPELWTLVRRRDESAWAAPRHYSSGHETYGGLFSILYGLNAYYLPFVDRADAPSWPLRVLRRNGYSLVAATASPLARRDAARAWLGQFDSTREFVSHGDHHDDQELVDWLVDAVLAGGIHEPFFALVFLNSTHHNYSYPERFAVHQPTLPEDYDHFMGDHRLSRFREGIHNRYKNSVRWIDHLLARTVDTLEDEVDDGTLLVAITGDHGEEFFEHGLLGHSASHLIDARIRVPLLLFGSGVSGLSGTLTSHVDIMPTLLDLLRASPSIEPARYADGLSLLGPEQREDGFVVVSAADRELGDLKLALVDRDLKLVIDAYGLGERFDLREATDVADRSLSTSQGLQTLEERIPELRQRLFRFVDAGGAGP